MQDETQLDDDGDTLEPLSPEDEAWLIGLLQQLPDITGDPNWKEGVWKRVRRAERKRRAALLALPLLFMLIIGTLAALSQ